MERMAVSDGADDCLDGFMGWRAQGKVLEKQQRHGEAVRALERALELTAHDNKRGRDELLTWLALASFNAGWPDEAMKWADLAMQEGVEETWLFHVHRVAGIACSNLGRLEDAQRHRQRAYEMAVQQADTVKTSDCLAGLADLHRLRGELDTAATLCLKAESLCPDAAQTAIVYHAIILRAQGRVEEALRRLEQASRVGALTGASGERRMQGHSARGWQYTEPSLAGSSRRGMI